VTAPSEGSVAVNGRVAPLVSVGVGFHPELTGRENVYVNGTILGLDREEIEARFDDIVAFSEIGDFIDTPVKFYSSGMFVRLGFSVAVHARPDVLLVDEVLAVGDLAFQMKCYDRMLRIRDEGTTIVVVSHNVHAVRRLCPRTLLVHRGAVLADGDTLDAVGKYYDILGEKRDPDQEEPLGDLPARGGITLDPIELLDTDMAPTTHIDSPADVVVRLEGRADRDLDAPVPGLNIIAADGTQVYSEWFPGALRNLVAGDRFRCDVRVRLTLGSGSYTVDAGLLTPDVRAILGWARPLMFSVQGRDTIAGLVDLGAQVAAQTLDAQISTTT
jgi:energy-coupling factor transporter ATP-binding protein EcfA2